MTRPQSETRLVGTIRKWIEDQPETWCFKHHGSPYSQAGIPDLIGCHFGEFFAFEVKVAGNKATPLQNATIEAIREASGYADVVFSLDDVQEWFAAMNKVREANDVLVSAGVEAYTARSILEGRQTPRPPSWERTETPNNGC